MVIVPLGKVMASTVHSSKVRLDSAYPAGRYFEAKWVPVVVRHLKCPFPGKPGRAVAREIGRQRIGDHGVRVVVDTGER